VPFSAARDPAATLDLFYVNCQESRKRNDFQQLQALQHNFKAHRVEAVIPASPEYVEVSGSPDMGPLMIPVAEVSTGAGANAILLSFLKVFHLVADAGCNGASGCLCDASYCAIITEDDLCVPGSFRARLAALVAALPADAHGAWLTTSTFAGRALGATPFDGPEPGAEDAGLGAGRFYIEWPRYGERCERGWAGRLVMPCEPAACIVTCEGARAFALALKARLLARPWRPFDVTIPELIVASSAAPRTKDGAEDGAGLKFFLAADPELVAPHPHRYPSARNVHSMRAFRASGIRHVLPSVEGAPCVASSSLSCERSSGSATAAMARLSQVEEVQRQDEEEEEKQKENVEEGELTPPAVGAVGEALAGLLHFAAAHEEVMGRRLLRRVPRKLLAPGRQC